MIKSWEDVFKEVSRECKKDDELPNWSPDDVRTLHMHLWDTVNYYLRNPLEVKDKILINEFFKFELRKFTLEKDVTKETIPQHKYELYNKLINKINGKG